MKTIELALHPIDGYLISITRDPENGWYVLEIGLPIKWVFDENTKIGCEVTEEYDEGKIIKISPKKTGIVIDDLINFVEIIIQTNEKIAEKEKQFTDKMAEMKGMLEKEANNFFKELDELRDNSFKKNNDSFEKTLEKPKTPRKPRKPKTPPADDITTTATNQLDNIETK